MDNATTRGFNYFIDLSIFIIILLTLFAMYYYDSIISNKVRSDNREANIVGQTYYSAMEDYEPYIGTSSYDGTYTLSETLSFIKENVGSKSIYVTKNNIQTNVNNMSLDGMLLSEYLDAGYISGLKEFIFDSYSDDTAKYSRYLDVSEDGSINAVYFYREVI